MFNLIFQSTFKMFETFQTELDMSDTVENFMSSDLGKKVKMFQTHMLNMYII